MGFTIGYTCAMATAPAAISWSCAAKSGARRGRSRSGLAGAPGQSLDAAHGLAAVGAGPVRGRYKHFRQTYSPLAVVDVLETLVKERRLTRRQASALEDYLLTTVTPEGAWRPERGHPHADHARLQSPCELYEAW